MYESPISITERLLDEYAKMVIERRDNEILAKVQSVVDVDVDKAELLRALQYDRNQYEKGYADAKAELVRCRDCKHCSANTPDGLHWCDEHERGSLMDDDFCSYGERREGE